MESSSGDEVEVTSHRSRKLTPPGNEAEEKSLVDELRASSDTGRNWKVRISTKSKKQEQKEQKSGRKGLRKKGKDLGKEERKRQKNGEGGALICFKVIKTNQYGKRQKRYGYSTLLPVPPPTKKERSPPPVLTRGRVVGYWRYLRQGWRT
jgi:hypothetical protein